MLPVKNCCHRDHSPCQYNERHVHSYRNGVTINHIEFVGRSQCRLYTRMSRDLRRDGHIVQQLLKSADDFESPARAWLARFDCFHSTFGDACTPPDLRYLQVILQRALHDPLTELEVPFGATVCPKLDHSSCSPNCDHESWLDLFHGSSNTTLNHH